MTTEKEKMQRQEDHDMLVEVKATLESGLRALNDKFDTFKIGHNDHESRIRVAEKQIDEAKGAITGLKWVIGVISALASAAFYLFGGHR